MSREKKAQIIDQLEEIFAASSLGILADYRGLSAPELTRLRRSLRERGVEFRVVKNTLARFAVERAGKDELVGFLDGPTALACGHGDVTEPAKALADYIRTSKITLNIKGGFLGDRLLTAEEVLILSALPSREILLAKIMGGMQAPILILLSHLTAPVRGLMGVIQARIQQLEGGQNAGG